MPEHNVIRINGTLPGGEVWSVNPRFTGNFGPPVQSYDGLLEWATAVAALNSGGVLPTPLRGLISTAAAVASIRAEFITATGTIGQAAEVTLPAPQPGQASATKPHSTALVSSLLTGRPGRSRRGRLYWPALAATIDSSTLRVTSAARDSYTTAIVGFLAAVEAAAPEETPQSLAVVSNTLDLATVVTQVSVGDILDVQRRRRDTLQEQRVTQPFPPVAP